MSEARPRRGLTIRARIAGGSLLIAALLAVPAGFLIDLQLRHIVRLGTVEVLSSDSAAYLSSLRAGATTFERPGPGQHIAVVRPDRTMAVDTLPAPLELRIDGLAAADDVRERTVGGTTYLVLSESEKVGSAQWHVVAARNRSSEDAVIGPMRVLLLIVLGVLVAGVGGTAWLLTRFSLRPVSRLQETAARLSTGSSRELLPVGDADDEISRLARTLNGLVLRLRDATDRERQLVSDASHELRTPVALLRTRLELAQAGDGDAAALRRDLAEAERSAVRLSALLTSLLELSTIESGARGTRATLAELRAEAADAVERAGFHADGSEIALEVTAAAGAPAGDLGADHLATVGVAPEDAGRILDNLIGNALAAMPRPGRILVTLTLGTAAAELRVADDAGGMPAELVPTALQRFTRGPGARSGQGAGLGLPIVAAIVAGAGGELRLDNRPGEGLTVVATLPVARA